MVEQGQEADDEQAGAGQEAELAAFGGLRGVLQTQVGREAEFDQSGLPVGVDDVEEPNEGHDHAHHALLGGEVDGADREQEEHDAPLVEAVVDVAEPGEEREDHADDVPGGETSLGGRRRRWRRRGLVAVGPGRWGWSVRWRGRVLAGSPRVLGP